MTLYQVFDADYEHDAYPDVTEIQAYTPGEAGKKWVQNKWSNYDHPDEMVCIVVEVSKQRRYRVTVNIEAQPVFYACVEGIDRD